VIKTSTDWGATILDHSHGYTCTILRRLKASHSKEHANSPVSCHTGARLPAGITLHVSTPAPNHTPHNPETVMPIGRLYMGEFASPSSYTTLFTTLLRLISQFDYRLDHHSANVPAGTFHSSAEDASPPHRKPLTIIGAFSTTVATQLFSPDKSKTIFQRKTKLKLIYTFQNHFIIIVIENKP